MMTEDIHTMSLDEYMWKSTVAPLLSKRLNSGDRMRLLDEAIDRIEDLQEEIAVLKARHERDSKEMQELFVDLRDKTLTLQDIADLHRGHGGDVWCPTERIVYLGHDRALDVEES
jgi:hypothetical protein